MRVQQDYWTEKFTDISRKSCHYVGDSYGGRSYINVNVPRGCSQSCACHKPYMSGKHAFTVRKRPTTMVVETHYDLLSSWLIKVLPIAPSDISNGFLLLKHLDLLEEHFRAFQEKKARHLSYNFLVGHELDRLEAALSLLIKGLLTDPQVFTSFGYQSLYDQGYLSYERWKKFHSSWTTDNIDILEASYDEDNGDQDPPDMISTVSSNFAPFPDDLGDQDASDLTSLKSWLKERSRLLRQSLRLDTQFRVEDSRDHEEMPKSLIAAVQVGDLESIGEEIEKGANPTLALAAAQETLHLEFVQSLLAEPSYLDFGTWAIPKSFVEGPLAIDLLIETVAIEDLPLLRLILHKGAPANKVFSPVPAPRDHLTTTRIFRAKGAASGRDLMTVAAHAQDHLMCKYFMSSGASFSQTLLAALEKRDLKCAYFLLQMAAFERGRQDIDFALPLLRMTGQPTGLERESKNVSLSNEEAETRKSRKRPSLRRFHIAFKQEHVRITNCAESWVDRPCRRRRKAFKKGIGVLRGLCRGQIPSTVSETVCFLAIARAMSIATNELSNLACNMFDFERDLGRWQMLFKMEDGTLPAFRNAVAGIWNVILDGTQVQHPDPSTLMIFCDLAFSIVQQVDNCFDLGSCSSSRLLSSQKNWRGQISSMPAAELGDHNFCYLTPEKSNKKPHLVSSGAPYSTWYQDRDPLPTQVPNLTMREAISNDRCLWSTNPLVRLLMAGAVFGIIITFLLGMATFYRGRIERS